MIMKKLFVFIITLAFITTLAACTPLERAGMSDQERRFHDVFDHLRDNHYKQLDEDDFWDGAIRGLFDTLDDPYSRYFSEEEYEQYRSSLGESFVGIGVTVENVDDNIVVRKVWSGSPAERGGIRTGDIVTHVDGVDHTDKSFLETILAVQGEEGTEVEIGVKRLGVAETLFLTMTREEIPNPTVEHHTIETDTIKLGYIKVNSFGTETAGRFKLALSEMEAQGIEGLIIDLRDNSGGSLQTVLELMRVFLIDDGNPLFTTESYTRGVPTTTEYQGGAAEPKPYDIITLINEHSASASEVFASAMKQHGGYEVIGMPSFGKGTMQTPHSTTALGGDELHVSTGIWRTANGTWVNKDGGDQKSVMPTIEVEQNPYFAAHNIFVDAGEVLGFDQVDPQIAHAQSILNALGYGDIRTDSYFDQDTEDAVMAFQAAHDLDATGAIDATTAQALTEAFLNYRNDRANDDQYQAAIGYFDD